MIRTPRNTPICKVIDANGMEWKSIVQVDTETGEAIQYVVDPDGLPQTTQDRTGLIVHTVTLPSPVLLVPIKREQANAE